MSPLASGVIRSRDVPVLVHRLIRTAKGAFRVLKAKRLVKPYSITFALKHYVTPRSGSQPEPRLIDEHTFLVHVKITPNKKNQISFGGEYATKLNRS